MNPSIEETLARVQGAMQSAHPDDIVSGVKAAVSGTVQALNPDATVEPTPYFNHTYMPDFVLSWRDRGKEQSRPIFLRNELGDRSATADIAELRERRPVILGLRPASGDRTELAGLRAAASGGSGVMVSDIGAMTDLASEEARVSPLMQLVRTNVLKGGRGLVLSGETARLTAAASEVVAEGAETNITIDAFHAAARDLFAEDAALRLVRSAELLKFGFVGGAEIPQSLLEGRLSDAELRVLLPTLLNSDGARNNHRLWAHLAGLMTLGDVEELGDVLDGVDVSPLVMPGAATWSARRAQLSLNADFEADANDEERLAIESGWRIKAHTLTANLGTWRFHVASDARRLKGRDRSAYAQWDDLSPHLSRFALEAVDLRGVVRRVTISAEESGDVARDVAAIRATLEDSYDVRSVSIRKIADEERSTILVDFSEMTASAAHGAPMSSLIEAASLLGYRSPVDPAALTDTAPSAEGSGGGNDVEQ